MQRHCHLLLLLLLPWHTISVSSGGAEIYLCDPISKLWGCTKFDPPSPPNTNCIMAGKENRIMAWAKAPQRSDHYTLRSGNGPAEASDSTTYRPNEFMTIHLQVLKTGWKYRGLLLNGVNDAGVIVGDFYNPSEPGIPHPSCPGSILHADADRKPYSSQFRYQAPPKGTGRITFRALIKRGLANTGYFHWPAKDLVLEEETDEKDEALASSTWHVTEDGQSCGQFCDGLDSGTGGWRCDAQAMAAVPSATDLSSAVGHTHPLFVPQVADCSPMSPATRVSDMQSFYHSKNCPSTQTPSCNVYKKGVTRFCACTTESGNRRRELTSDGFMKESAAARPSSPSMLVWVLVFGSVLILLSTSVPTVSAHNWMPTPGRAWNTASTTMPCLARKSTDTHQQVGPGQSFTLGFQTGHGGQHYLFVVHEDDEKWLAHPKLLDMAKEYVRDAPDGSDSSLESKWKRYHGTRKETSASEMKRYNDDIAGKKSNADNKQKYPRLYNKIVHRRLCGDGITGCVEGQNTCNDGSKCTSNSEFFDHTRMTVRRLFEYTDAALKEAGDRRVSYKSTKFPWLEKVHLYQNVANIGADFDLVRATIPGRKGSGHYIVHWRWRGFRDCVDVDVFKDRTIDKVDGTSGNGIIWNKVEHCQFEKPKSVLTPCRLVPKTTNTTKVCIDDLYATLRDSIRRPQLRAGINVVPRKLPDIVKVWDRTVVAPFHEPTCVQNNPLARISGKDTYSVPQGGWTSWRASSRVKELLGKKCTKSLFVDKNNKPVSFSRTLRAAVLDCTDERCKGFAWKTKTKDLFDALPDTKFEVFFCKATVVADETGWNVVLKDDTALVVSPTVAAIKSSLPFAPTDANAATETMVSFQSKNSDTTASIPAGFQLGNNFFVDEGKVYGARGNGQNYGWNCAQTDSMKNAYNHEEKKAQCVL